MITDSSVVGKSSRFPVPSLEEQRSIVEEHKLETLLYCPHPWALRHRFVNQQTGETVRVKCNRWDCLYCGPRKVDQWRQLVKAAEPTLFLTLTKAGQTVEEAARALTTFMQALRRGSKGLGKNHKGARPAYPVEYFAVLERHKDFEQNGFHWHLLLRGVDRIPYKEVIQPLWRSARHGKAEIGHIEAIRKPQAIGYVTKYLTKDITRDEKGYRTVEYTRSAMVLDAQKERTLVPGLDEQGNAREIEQAYVYMVRLDELGKVVEQQETATIQAVSKAHRIRYSRGFFPERVADLRVKLFTHLEEQSSEQREQVEGSVLVENQANEGESSKAESRTHSVVHEVQDDTDRPREDDTGRVVVVPEQKPTSWRLIERDEFTSDPEQYKKWRCDALMEALVDLRAGIRKYSRRVVTTWAYQRNEYNRSHELAIA